MSRGKKRLTFEKFVKIMKKDVRRKVELLVNTNIKVLWHVLKEYNPNLKECELKEALNVMKANGVWY